MFRLQRLEITGFKSFADYTEVIFTGDGITAVVGPNGCGKSNVSESIAWVLGEQRAKALRGSEMQDVIFQGTNKRNPSGMAEVVLHLVRDEEAFFEDEEHELGDIDEALSDIDERAVQIEDFEPDAEEASANGHHENGHQENGFDADAAEVVTAETGSALAVQPAKIKTKRHWRPRRLALDFAPGESVSVTRRLYRSGESEYLLNGKTCRLRDIQDLFAGTGLSGAHYAIIEQGRIGQILSAKPSDRRTLIEEAAGISKFRTRQRAAETRLESAKTNLRRISDIVEEIEKQANSLRRQAAKTRRFKILKEELRVTLRQVFAAEGSYLTELVGELETRLDEAVKIERELFSQVTAKEESFRTATQKAREAEEELSDLRALHAENALQRDRAERDLQYKQEQIANLQTRVEVLKGEVEATRQRLKLVKAEAERLEKDERKERAEAEKQELALRAAEDKYQEKLGELRNIEAELEKARAEVFQHTTAFERLSEIGRQHESTIQRLTERAEGLKREGVRAEETLDSLSAESEKLEKELAKAHENQAALQEEKRALTGAASAAREILQAAERELSNLREQFSRTRHRLESLQELEQRRAIYAPTVQKLFAEQKKIGVKFSGTLADKLHVEAEAEKAVENVFGAFLQAVLVETEEDARKTLAYLNENKLGRLGILVFNTNGKGAKSEPPAVAGGLTLKNKNQKAETLLSFLGISGDFEKLLAEVFPRETSAEMVENLEKVKSKSSEIFVDSEGDLMIGGKLFIGGKANASEKNSSLLAFKRELRELESTGEKLKKEIEKAEKETEKARKSLAEKEDKIVDLQSFIVKFEREVLSQEIQFKTLKQEIERAERHKRVVGEETKQIEKELEEIQAKRAETGTNAGKAEKARIAATEKLEKISRYLSEARQKVERENADLNEKRTAAGVAAERRRSVSNSLRRIEAEATELESRLARQNLEINENEAGYKNLTASIAEISGKIESAKETEEAENEELAEASANLKNARENADAMSAALADLNKRSAEARNSRAEFEVRQAESLTRLKNLNEICAHELGQSLVELVETVEIAEDFDLEAERRQTDEMRSRIESFGAVNMLALEELSETEERLLFLTSQRQDIIDGIAAAEAALREIKQRSRERFRHAFEAINEYFREFFLELFGGGRGEMTLLDAEDVLESGIEIVAQPPGKRLQNILLLSGGEKAMTAIALVMAIFKYRPSPFCLLDEVDAPLDDANVGRFVNKIAEMSEKTQFIVITHNKRTMEAARALYGVTMEEAGVSKVVSVRFE
ncbi:MAG TPA: chromosome segregation protein SMC [Pyrinomonadaceae bacterium]|jgi:chromosome segregation protein